MFPARTGLVRNDAFDFDVVADMLVDNDEHDSNQTLNLIENLKHDS